MRNWKKRSTLSNTQQIELWWVFRKYCTSANHLLNEKANTDKTINHHSENIEDRGSFKVTCLMEANATEPKHREGNSTSFASAN